MESKTSIIKHKIYVSYAEADKEWVCQFVNWLKDYLKRELAQIDNISIWWKYMLKGNEDIVCEPRKQLKSSDILLVILSSAYIKTKEVVEEISEFRKNIHENTKNIFVIKRDRVENPKEIKNMVGYNFWYEDESGKIRQMGTLEIPKDDKYKYYNAMRDVACDLAERIEEKELKQKVDSLDINKKVAESNVHPTIYIGYVTDSLREKYNNLKRYLEDKNFNVLPKIIYKPDDKDSINKDLEISQFFLLLDEESEYSQIQCQCVKDKKDKDIRILRWYNTKNQSINVEYCSENSKVIVGDFETFKSEVIRWIEKEFGRRDFKDSEQCYVLVNTNDNEREIVQKIKKELAKNYSTKSRNNSIFICNKALPSWIGRQLNPNVKVFTLNKEPKTNNISLKEVHV